MRRHNDGFGTRAWMMLWALAVTGATALLWETVFRGTIPTF